ncbi:hypothetical protein ACFL3G_11080, partial [Planctomycetota bacterium]
VLRRIFNWMVVLNRILNNLRYLVSGLAVPVAMLSDHGAVFFAWLVGIRVGKCLSNLGRRFDGEMSSGGIVRRMLSGGIVRRMLSGGGWVRLVKCVNRNMGNGIPKQCWGRCNLRFMIPAFASTSLRLWIVSLVLRSCGNDENGFLPSQE